MLARDEGKGPAVSQQYCGEISALRTARTRHACPTAALVPSGHTKSCNFYLITEIARKICQAQIISSQISAIVP